MNNTIFNEKLDPIIFLQRRLFIFIQKYFLIRKMNYLLPNKLLVINGSNNKQNKEEKCLAEAKSMKPNELSSVNYCSQFAKLALRQHGDKGLSLLQCKSSKSICSLISEHNNIDLKLASDFLQSDTQQQYIQALKHMWGRYGTIQIDQYITFLKLERDENDIEGQLLSHYLGAWLYFMGYSKSSNKKYILSRVRMHIGLDKVSKAAQIYQNLFRLSQGIAYEERLGIIVDTCKQGWEFFISLTIKYLKDQLVKGKSPAVDKYLTSISMIQNANSSHSSNLRVYELDQDQNIQSLSK